MTTEQKYLYVFLDDGGDLTFASQGTRFFALGAVSKERPFTIEPRLLNLKYDLIESGSNIEYFHASEDRQGVRDRVFDNIMSNPSQLRVDSVVADKRRTDPALQIPERFYPRALGELLQHILNGRHVSDYDEIIVITDTLPVKSKRRAFEKGIKLTLARMLPSNVKYRILHHASKSCMGLQIADYCTWAVFRKWERGDSRSLDLIKEVVCSEIWIPTDTRENEV